jgi:hypothetical protein
LRRARRVLWRQHGQVARSLAAMGKSRDPWARRALDDASAQRRALDGVNGQCARSVATLDMAGARLRRCTGRALDTLMGKPRALWRQWARCALDGAVWAGRAVDGANQWSWLAIGGANGQGRASECNMLTTRATLQAWASCAIGGARGHGARSAALIWATHCGRRRLRGGLTIVGASVHDLRSMAPLGRDSAIDGAVG